MATTEKMTALTVRVNNNAVAYAITTLAAEQNRSVEEIVEEALRAWLERQEELEDLAAIAEVEGEPTIPWEQVKEEMRQARANARAE
jgi:predicted transcriptional regulator